MGLDKIKVDDTVYEYFKIECENPFIIIIKSNDYKGVKNAFENAKSIIVMNSIGQVIKNITNFSGIGPTMELPKYYMDENNIFRSAIQITLKSLDVNEKVKILESKLDTTVNEAAMTLDEYKNYRINQSKEALEQYISDHPLKSSVHGGVEATYTITSEKQSWMAQQLLTYQLEKATNPNAILTWNERGEVCEEWTEEEFLQLLLEVKYFIYPLRAYQQTIEKQIMKSMDKAEIAAIVFDYDNAIPSK